MVAFAVSGLASNWLRLGKPFNPLLGETYQLEQPNFRYRYTFNSYSFTSQASFTVLCLIYQVNQQISDVELEAASICRFNSIKINKPRLRPFPVTWRLASWRHEPSLLGGIAFRTRKCTPGKMKPEAANCDTNYCILSHGITLHFNFNNDYIIV